MTEERMCTSGDHGDIPAVGEAQVEDDPGWYPYCTEGEYRDVRDERDRLRAQIRDLMTHNVDAIDLMNIEYGCPDCGVHHACSEIVAERDRLQAIIDGCPRCGQRILLTPESLGDGLANE